jgi:hypothetical protein
VPIQAEDQGHNKSNKRKAGQNHFNDSKFFCESYVLWRGEHFESEPSIEICEKLWIAKHYETPSAYPDHSNDIEKNVDAL